MRNSLKLADAKAATPPVQIIGKYAAQLREALYDACSEGELVDVMKSQVAKAKAGDTKAAKFVIDYLTGGAAKQAQAPAPGGASVGEIRAMICRYLAHHHLASEIVLANIFGFAGDEDAVLEGCDLFEEDETGWGLTKRGESLGARKVI
jgi:hypothetical protein